MKNVSIIILLTFLIVVIGVLAYTIYATNNEMSILTTSVEKLTSENSDLQQNLQEKINELASIKPEEIRLAVTDLSKFEDVESKGIVVKLDSTAKLVRFNEKEVVVYYITEEDTTEQVTVQDVTKNVVDVIGGMYSNGQANRLFMLMEDGTVEMTTPLEVTTSVEGDTKEEEVLKSTGTVSGLSNIVKIAMIETSEDVLGGIPVAIDKEGNIHRIHN